MGARSSLCRYVIAITFDTYVLFSQSMFKTFKNLVKQVGETRIFVSFNYLLSYGQNYSTIVSNLLADFSGRDFHTDYKTMS